MLDHPAQRGMQAWIGAVSPIGARGLLRIGLAERRNTRRTAFVKDLYSGCVILIVYHANDALAILYNYSNLCAQQLYTVHACWNTREEEGEKAAGPRPRRQKHPPT
jgi:hypothetical protein